MTRPLSANGYQKRAKREVLARLRRAGVVLDWADTEDCGRATHALRVRVKRWVDGTWTVNLVDVPGELAQACIDVGLARGTRW